jgi:cation diffusion facilitator CzcD-associated flavoprotein CzcO
MPRIAIIGSGFAGICAAIQLKSAGFSDIVLFEQADSIGGTWRDNSYPGAACDIPSALYSYSFELNLDWSRKWSPQAEIRAYIEHCVEKYDIRPLLRLATGIESAEYDDTERRWCLLDSRGETHRFDILITGVGQLSKPALPDIPGREEFSGSSFHSARWDHDVDIGNKRVAVIGNAASAIQLIPKIATSVRELLVFQRSPNWMLPKKDRAYHAWERKLARRLPFSVRLHRWWIWLKAELLLYPVMRGNRLISGLVGAMSRRYLRDTVGDPEMRARLVPDYPIGAKRVLFDVDYYAALGRGNVRLIDTGITRLDSAGVVDNGGTLHEADVLIYATGFDTTHFLTPMVIRGRRGQLLAERWGESPSAYLGITVPGFPNLFQLYGPNTNLGHNSIIFMIECQTRYIVDGLRQMRELGLAAVEVGESQWRDFDNEVQAALATSSWSRIEHSWYRSANGRIVNNWPWSLAAYWWRTRHFDLDCYRQWATESIRKS